MAAAAEAVQRVARRQKLGKVRSDLDARRTLLAMIALSWFPVAFPQLTRLIMGESASKKDFMRSYREFLKKFAVSFGGRKHERERNGKTREISGFNGKGRQ